MKAAALALLLAAAGSAAYALPNAVAAADTKPVDWSKTVVATPEGGYRMGNPAAPVKLVEYGSLTCGHCAVFAAEAKAGLVERVRAGTLSFEFRNFVRDPADMGAALLSRCAGPDKFFALTDSYFAAQPDWMGRLRSLSRDEIAAVNALPPAEKIGRFAAHAGLDALAAKAGVTPARAKACLGDQEAVARLVEMRRAAVATYDLQGTPTFVINGVTAAGAHDWASLEPLLGSPGG